MDDRDRIGCFLSYAVVDEQWAKWIMDILREKGYSTHVDAKLLDFSRGIRNYIEKAEFFIAIITPNYLSSTACQAEFSIAQACHAEILLVIVSEVNLPANLARYECIDLYHADEKQAKESLLNKVYSSNKSKPSISTGKNEPSTTNSKYPKTISINNLQFNNNEELVEGGIEKVNAIKDAFDKNNTVSSTLTLSGEGGTGKTTIARKYIFQFGYLYNVIWWIRAINWESILQDYRDFVNKMKLSARQNGKMNSEKLINTVKYWMKSNSNWLFVFDDVTDFDMIQSFIPKKHRGNILITSRVSLWKNVGINTIKIDVFSTETAVGFLKSHNVEGTDKELEILSKILGNVPSKLKAAAKIITDNKLSISDFLNRLQTDRENRY